VCLDRLAVRQRPRALESGGTVGALWYTTVIPHTRAIVLNVETDDYGVLEERECACEIGGLGLSLHLHTIRSHEKLTGDGTSFLGETLVTLVEDVLPARFGGYPTDYQIVEREREGVTRVHLIVDPRLGPLEPSDVVRESLSFLRRSGGADQVMAETWRAGEMLQVVRGTPYITAAGKVLPLHVDAGS
jgi:hypothetical protein